MRKIDWEKPLSDEDIVWLRQSGMLDVEGRIERHQEAMGGQVPDDEVLDDTLTRSALDPRARVANRVEGLDGGPIDVTPPPGDLQAGDAFEEEEESDDYDSWKVAELEDEVAARDNMENTTEVKVEGTGKDGAIRKPDLIKGLRLWDQENAGAIKD